VAYDVQLTGPARLGLQRIPPRVFSAVVEFAFGDLEREPHRVGKPPTRLSKSARESFSVPHVGIPA